MVFKTAPLNITGPSYQSRSRPLSSQQTVNWRQQFNEAGKDSYVLIPFDGLKFVSNAAGSDRGLHVMNEILYQVKGASLYSISKSGTQTLKGSLPGTSRAIMADDGINLFIVSDLKVYQYSSDTNLITEITDLNITGSTSVTFINNQFIYTKSGLVTVGGKVEGPGYSIVSDVGDGSTASGLNIIGAESLPDTLIRDYVFDEIIYRFGTRTTEAWYNSGVGQPPIDRLQGRVFSVGLGALHSIAHTDEGIYWLGDDLAIYRSQSGAKQKISTDAISNELRTYATVSSAVGHTFTLDGANYYMISFPAGNKTFVLNEGLGPSGWFELSTGTSGDIYQASSIIAAYNKNMVADWSGGNIYELDEETYTNDSNPIRRVRVTQEINGDILGAKGKRVQMSRLKIILEAGTGLINGQGDNPRIMIEYSDDGGRSWAEGAWPRVGRLGEFTLQVEWDDLGSFYGRIIRLSTSDPVNYSIYSATVDLRLAGR